MHQIIKADYMAEKQKEALFKSKGEKGEHTESYPPYGYIKGEKDKYKWVVNGKIGIDKKRMYIKQD